MDTRVLVQRHQYVAEYIQFKNMERSQFAKNAWKSELYRFLFFQSAPELALSWCLPLLSNREPRSPWRRGFNSLQRWRALSALVACLQLNNELARSNMYGCINPIKLLEVASVASIQVVTVFDSWERRLLSREWAWFQRRQRTRPQRLRAESLNDISSYFKFLFSNERLDFCEFF